MKTYDVNVKEFTPLISPADLKEELPITEKAARTVISGRQTIQDIIGRKDPRLLVITGPCSIHDEKAALEYAERLCRLKDQVDKTLYLVMRVYFEKPRTNVGWKGLLNDPGLDGSCDMMQGLLEARRLLISHNGNGTAHSYGNARSDYAAIYSRPDFMVCRRRPNNRIANPPGDGEWSVNAGGF